MSDDNETPGCCCMVIGCGLLACTVIGVAGAVYKWGVLVYHWATN